MTACRGRRGTAPLILKLCTKRRRHPHAPDTSPLPRKEPWVPAEIKGCLYPRAGLGISEKSISHASIRTPDHPARSLQNKPNEVSRLPDYSAYSLEVYPSATRASNHYCHKLLYDDKLYLACNMQESKSRHEKQPTAVM